MGVVDAYQLSNPPASPKGSVVGWQVPDFQHSRNRSASAPMIERLPDQGCFYLHVIRPRFAAKTKMAFLRSLKALRWSI